MGFEVSESAVAVLGLGATSSPLVDDQAPSCFLPADALGDGRWPYPGIPAAEPTHLQLHRVDDRSSAPLRLDGKGRRSCRAVALPDATMVSPRWAGA